MKIFASRRSNLTQSAKALLIATMDTKGREALFISTCLKQAGTTVLVMDAGIRGASAFPVDISREAVAKAGGKSLVEVQHIDHEGQALEVMTKGAIACAQSLYRQDRIQGVIGLGGSMGTTLVSGVMRSLPVGVPKVMISTMASRDTRAFVGTKDILMLHSVCDLAGLNRLTRKILRNGALALAGMLQPTTATEDQLPKPLIFLSTLGTTEACARQVRQVLEEKGNEVVIFHTVGAGGQAMEEMIEPQGVSALVDLSLHELADHRFGGDYDAGPDRGRKALQLGLPTILVPGNIDFLVSGPLEAARRRFPGRPYHAHNAAITVVRSTQAEIEMLSQTIAHWCNAATGLVKILVPMDGFSAFDSVQGPLYDPAAAQLFAKTFQKHLVDHGTLSLLPYHINDPEFAEAIVEAFYQLIPLP
jgi:uncharacterized protein (UPF0261 family)